MTPKEWNECDDPATLIEWLKQRDLLDEQRVRLYCCACCRRVWEHLGPWTKRAIEVAERFAVRQATEQELSEARTSLMGGPAGCEIEREFQLPMENLDVSLRAISKLGRDNPLDDPEYAEISRRFMGAIGDSILFGKTQGPLHHVAYSAIDAHDWISSQITQHLEEPAATVEKIAHANLVRQIFADPF